MTIQVLVDDIGVKIRAFQDLVAARAHAELETPYQPTSAQFSAAKQQNMPAAHIAKMYEKTSAKVEERLNTTYTQDVPHAPAWLPSWRLRGFQAAAGPAPALLV